jgi:hypothetical protein
VVRFSYAAAVRLYAIAADNWWTIDGTCARAGVDAGALAVWEPDRFCSLIYSWAEDRLKHDEKVWQRWRNDLTSPLPGRSPDRVSPSVVEDEMAMFRRFNPGG